MANKIMYKLLARIEHKHITVAYALGTSKGEIKKLKKSVVYNLARNNQIINCKCRMVYNKPTLRGVGINLLKDLPVLTIDEKCNSSNTKKTTSISRYEITARIVQGSRCVAYTLYDNVRKTKGDVDRKRVLKLANDKKISNALCWSHNGKDELMGRGGANLKDLPIIYIDENGKRIQKEISSNSKDVISISLKEIEAYLKKKDLEYSEGSKQLTIADLKRIGTGSKIVTRFLNNGHTVDVELSLNKVYDCENSLTPVRVIASKDIGKFAFKIDKIGKGGLMHIAIAMILCVIKKHNDKFLPTTIVIKTVDKNNEYQAALYKILGNNAQTVDVGKLKEAKALAKKEQLKQEKAKEKEFAKSTQQKKETKKETLLDYIEKVIAKEYSSNEPDEIAIKITNKYIALQTCDNGYDYSIYDEKYNLCDGGVLESDESIAKQIAGLIKDKSNNISLDSKQNLIVVDYDLFMEQVTKAESAKIEQQKQKATATKKPKTTTTPKITLDSLEDFEEDFFK